MKMRIQADLIFNHPADAAAALAYLKQRTNQLGSLNTASSNEEASFIIMHPCRHEEPGPPPCEVSDAWTNASIPPAEPPPPH